MHRFGAVFADIAVICSKRTVSGKSFAVGTLPSRSWQPVNKQQKCSLISPLLFSLTALINEHIG
jgi:hypothetical protein